MIESATAGSFFAASISYLFYSSLLNNHFTTVLSDKEQYNIREGYLIFMGKTEQKISWDIVSVSTALVIIVLLAIVGFGLYHEFFGYRIRARFTELAPLGANLPVYCKGKKIGRTRGVTLNKDYKFSTLKILLFPQKLALPTNSIATIKKTDCDEKYIEIIYPQTPSKEFLKDGNTIEGKTDWDLDTLIAKIGEVGDWDTMVKDFEKTLKNMKDASNEIGQFFFLFSAVLEDNKANIKQATKNAASTTENLDSVSLKLNNSIKEENLKTSVANFDKSSQNIKDSSERIKEASENVKEITEKVETTTNKFDKTMTKIDTSVDDANEITAKVKDITSGVQELLCKRFAGMKILFGKPMDCDCCGNKCPKACKTTCRKN